MAKTTRLQTRAAAPRKRDWDRLGEAQRKRYTRAGITPSYYESGGRLFRARGHREKEHITRRERNPDSLSIAPHYSFIRAQARRNGMSFEEFKDEGFVDFYRSLSDSNRELMRDRVRNEHAAWKRRGKRPDPSREQPGTKGGKDYLTAYTEELKSAYPWFPEGMVALMFYH